jgi:predicted N-formylglutamate amidohydrolase
MRPAAAIVRRIMDDQPSQPQAASPSLLAPDEPGPVVVENADAGAPVLVVCDHAANFIPRALDGLGLPPAELERHIAYDIGILPVARQVAEALDAPLVRSNFSRLIVDPNRQLDDATLMPEIADGTIVTGNRGLTDAEVGARLETFFWPYHHEITRRLEAIQARGVAPVLISLHSFTPVMHGRQRPWEVGILWDRDERLPVPAMDWLAARGWTVGDNEPYSGRDHHGYTQHVHGDRLGLPNILLEIRQDHIADGDGQARWAAELVAMLRTLLADETLYHARPR